MPLLYKQALFYFCLLLPLLLLLFCSAEIQVCQSDLECNLNGICDDAGTCHCDDAWMGKNCSKLILLPTSAQSGYRPSKTSSWGGSVMYFDGLYHMFPAEMVESCGLSSWKTNSRIIHATSKRLEGPYTFQKEVIGVWSHNPTIVKASDGTLLLLSAGYGSDISGSGMPPPEVCGPTGCCSNGASPCGIHRGHPCNAAWPPQPDPDPAARNPLGAYRNFTAYISPNGNPFGPWIPTILPTNEETHQYTPSGVTFPNGTVVVLLVGGGMFRADHSWAGPYQRWGNGMYWGCGGEDPFLYIDKRGHWHCLFHSGPYNNLSSAGGHSFSLDGLNWHTTPEPTYRGDYIEEIFEHGIQRTKIAKRERPHLVFDEDGNILALITGICYGENWALCNNNPWPGYFDRTFTHVQLVAGRNHGIFTDAVQRH